MSEQEMDAQIPKIWAWVVIVCCLIVCATATVCTWLSRDTERRMAEAGYEQGSVPGQNGVFWVKTK